MNIEHVTIWVDDIELMKQFYMKYFNVSCGEKCVNTKKNVASYFLSFGGEKTNIEFMNIPDMGNPAGRENLKGLAHFTISVKGKRNVINLTEKLSEDGYTIAREAKKTEDGYYESAVLDPEGNYIAITDGMKRRWSTFLRIFLPMNVIPI